MSAFHWQQIHAHTDADSVRLPCPREAPTGMLSHQGRLHVFGFYDLWVGREA